MMSLHPSPTTMRASLGAVLAAVLLALSSGPATAAPLPAPAQEASDDDSIGRGDLGAAVTAWQERLNDWLELTGSDLFPIVVDGDFGPQTETATREFQRASSAVFNDGTVDDDDRVALEASIDALEDVGADDPEPTEIDETVVWWQTALNDWLALTDSDLFPIVVDGDFGPQTETATREFQRSNAAVDNDGTVDGDDRVALEAAIDAIEDSGAGDTAPEVASSPPVPGGTDDDGTDQTVVWWQTALNNWLALTDSDLFPIVVDGDFGPQTETATREFQRADPDVVNDGSVEDDDRVAIEAAIEALESGAIAADDAAEADASADRDAVSVPMSDEVAETMAWWQERLNRWLQLVASSAFPIVVDGIFGPQTESATREFQDSYDTVDEDGSVDPIDRVVLDDAIGALESGAAPPSSTAAAAETDAPSEQVAWWQEGLNTWLELTDSDLFPIVVDGDFGPQTETATREFQAATDGVDVDGVVDQADRVALESAIAALGG